ncbi:MAG: WbqC family protein [bacterium]
MKIAVMQPYFFPYLGYYQLLHAADIFVILDDVSYSKRKWVRSNFIRSKNGPIPIGIPLLNSSRDTLICDLLISEMNYDKAMKKIFRSMNHSYGCDENNISDIIKVLNRKTKYLADLTINSLKQVNGSLDFGCQILCSRDLRSQVDGGGQDYILNLCEYLGGSCYVNPPGGYELYDKKIFAKKGIELNFIEMSEFQKNKYFFQGKPISMLDTIFFCLFLLDRCF